MLFKLFIKSLFSCRFTAEQNCKFTQVFFSQNFDGFASKNDKVMIPILSKVYVGLIKLVDPLVPNKFRPLWNHPAGPRTVFFWAPLGKSALIFAGIGDLSRPAEKLSLSQSASLGGTALIWARWSTIIIPKNIFMMCVNLTIFATQSYQFTRAYLYQKNASAKKVDDVKK